MIQETLDLLDRIEAGHVDPLSAALSAAMDHMVLQLRSGSGFSIQPPYRRQITERLSSLWLDTADGAINLMLSELKGAFPLLEKKEELTATRLQILNNYISRFGAGRASNIIHTTEQQIRDLINGGLAQGEAADAVFSQVTDKVPELANLRALLISRTEAHAVSQYTSQKMAERSQIPLDKIWNTTQDMRVRDFGFSGRVSQFNHRIMQGQAVGLYQSFQVPTLGGGFESLQFIGDPSGSAGNVINCRCVQTYRRKD